MKIRGFKYHFQKNRIMISHYFIQSPKKDSNSFWTAPISWYLSGRKDDNSEWEVIDHVTESKIDGNLIVLTRSVNSSGPYTSFRLNMIGKNYGDITALRIYKLDFFGSIDPPYGCFMSLSNNKTELIYAIIVFIIHI